MTGTQVAMVWILCFLIACGGLLVGWGAGWAAGYTAGRRFRQRHGG